MCVYCTVVLSIVLLCIIHVHCVHSNISVQYYWYMVMFYVIALPLVPTICDREWENVSCATKNKNCVFCTMGFPWSLATLSWFRICNPSFLRRVTRLQSLTVIIIELPFIKFYTFSVYYPVHARLLIIMWLIKKQDVVKKSRRFFKHILNLLKLDDNKWVKVIVHCYLLLK